jgi:phenylacetate-CoA ligase
MSIDFRLADFFHPVEIWRLRRTLERTQWLPEEELRAYQDARLRQILDRAFSRVPFYRRLASRFGLRREDFKTAEDLTRLPLLRKETVRRFGELLTAEDAHRFAPRWYATSGSSGRPLRFCLDKTSNSLEFVYYWRHWGWGGYRLGDAFAEISSHYFLTRPHLADRCGHYQRHLRRLLLNGGLISVASAPAMAEALNRHRPRFLKGTASALYFLALSLKEAGCERAEFRCIFSTGEVLTEMHRELIRSTFRAPVLDSYGHMERTVAVSQCLRGGYHINSDYGLLQVEDRRPNGEGGCLGRVVGTSLYNRAMPLIRYDVGDEIELSEKAEPCACGRTLPLVRAIHGRGEDAIITPDGRFVTTLFLVNELVPGVRFVQFVQTRADLIEINLVPAEDWSDRSREEILAYTARMTGPEMRLQLKLVAWGDLAEDASGKVRVAIGLG